MAFHNLELNYLLLPCHECTTREIVRRSLQSNHKRKLKLTYCQMVYIGLATIKNQLSNGFETEYWKYLDSQNHQSGYLYLAKI